MSDFLITHAYQNAWCNPGQDQQFIIQPARISSPLGVHTDSIHMWDRVLLPLPSTKFQVYQIGQVHPAFLGLLPHSNIWMNCADMMGAENLIIDLYTKNGLKFPRAQAWIMVTPYRDIILAVQEQPRIANLRRQPLFMRVYSNAYFASVRANADSEKIECRGIISKNANEALSLQQDYNLAKALNGFTWLYWNGRLVDNFNPNQVAFGDTLEYVYDSSVKEVRYIPISSLETFDSTRDQLRKYLIHATTDQLNGPTIDYRDDLDIHLVKKNGNAFTGTYYHKNSNASLRNVTHRDYSIPVMHVLGYVNDNPFGWTDSQALSLQIVVRDSGYQRGLIDEAHRIKELEKLPYDKRKAAMIGTDALAGIWHADSLENSPYIQVMESKSGLLTRLTVQEAYGYNAMVCLEANSPLQITNQNGRWQTDMPIGLRAESTVYEFNAEGVLLDVHHHRLGSEYTIVDPDCRLIEGIPGFGSIEIDTRFGHRQLDILPAYNYRFYIADLYDGVVNNSTWRDVTGDTSKYAVVNNRVVWFTDPEVNEVAVRSDRNFLAYQLEVTPINGVLTFAVEGDCEYPTTRSRLPLAFPMGKLDLWLNGKSLIENVDYFVKWPQVTVVNKTYLNDSGVQRIHVRMVGHCMEDMSRIVPADIGFVEYGLLSHNNRFDIRDDRLLRMVIRGLTVHRSRLQFSEHDLGVMVNFVPNGSPYLIEKVVMPLRKLVGPKNSWTYMKEAAVVDKAVSDYLSLKLPEPDRTIPDYVPDAYAIYSPFASAVMHDMLRGVIRMDDFQGQYSNQDVYEHLKGYTYLLDFDPTKKHLDSIRIAIHPHEKNEEVVLDIYQYNLLERAIHVFLDDKVDITKFISIKPTWV